MLARDLVMSVRRIVPDITSDRMDETRDFYAGFLGLEMAMNLGWIMTFVSPSHSTAQLTVVKRTRSSEPHPDVTVEVSDVDATHKRAIDRGFKIVYPLTDESWGVRRFFVEDPNGVVLNVMCHRDVPSPKYAKRRSGAAQERDGAAKGPRRRAGLR
jgi:catechol 2,3-dioxygenase-like lactoylglutathione lyase family enzyme